MIKRIRNKIIDMKFYLQRATHYISVVNSGMILYLTLSTLKNNGIINVNLSGIFFISFFGSLIGFILVGWLEVNFLKGLKYETTKFFANNPDFVDMKKKLDYLYEKEVKNEARIQSSSS